MGVPHKRGAPRTAYRRQHRRHYHPVFIPDKILYEKQIKSKISGNEVYYAACFLLVILKNSCSKLHSQTGFNVILFSYQIAGDKREDTRARLLGVG